MNMFKRPVGVACLIRIRTGAGVWTAELIYPEHWSEPPGDAVAPEHPEGHDKLQHAKIDAAELLFGFGEVQYADFKENLWKAMSQEVVNDAQEDQKNRGIARALVKFAKGADKFTTAVSAGLAAAAIGDATAAQHILTQFNANVDKLRKTFI
jgi:hypothetical protein